MLTPNKDKKITFRLSDEDYQYLNAIAFMSGMTVSKYVRTLIDASINAIKVAEKQGKVNLEDFKTVQHD